MTIDERTEALTMNLELAHRDLQDQRENIRQLATVVHADGENIRELAVIARSTLDSIRSLENTARAR